MNSDITASDSCSVLKYQSHIDIALCIPRVIPERQHDFIWQPSARVPNTVRSLQSSDSSHPASEAKSLRRPTHLPLLQKVEGTYHLVSREWPGGIKVKVKFTLEQVTMAQREEAEVQLYSFFTLSVIWGWVINGTPRPLYPWERDPVPIV